MVNGYLLFILGVLFLSYLLELVAALCNLRRLSPVLSTEFAGLYDAQEYQRSQEYTRVSTRFSLVQSSFMLLVTVAFILNGGFNWVDTLARGPGWGPIPTGLVFTGVLALLNMLVQLPFQLYATFGIEQRFGFNTTTWSTYFFDQTKIILLGVVLGGPLLALILWFFTHFGSLAWLYCWGAAVLFVLVVQVVAPILIMPLFNRFTPLPEGSLREAITAYAQAQRFALQGIFTMDGSRRSNRANAFFTGLGRFRRIVFFDTLLQQLEENELLAVLAHEMGHYKLRHVPGMLLLSCLQMGLMFFILSLFLGNAQLCAAFGMEHVSVYASLVFFGFLFSPLSLFLGLGMQMISRRNEYQADHYAAKTLPDGEGAVDLISGLKKLSVRNLSNLTPHPFYVALHYSHPPILERIAALREHLHE